ncbi:hypothetical protein [Mycobacterium sp.]|uniref:hypothetical protein n=1 Tax=Mycobacterium sp. TaxID=1785 RepID=UPI003F97CC22
MPVKLKKLDDSLDVANDSAGGAARNISVTVPGKTAAEAEAKAREVLNNVGVVGDLALVETVIESTAEEVPDRPEIIEAEKVPLEEPGDSRRWE